MPLFFFFFKTSQTSGGVKYQTLSSFVCTLPSAWTAEYLIILSWRLENTEEGSDGKVSQLSRILTLADATAGQHLSSSPSKASNFFGDTRYFLRKLLTKTIRIFVLIVESRWISSATLPYSVHWFLILIYLRLKNIWFIDVLEVQGLPPSPDWWVGGEWGCSTILSEEVATHLFSSWLT